MTTLHDRLAEIQARADAATEGPWLAEERNTDDPFSLTTVYNVFHNGDTPDRDLVAEVAYDNAEFIASARRDVPTLVVALRAVLDLHRPVDIEPSATACRECSYQLPNGLYLGKIEEYPCSTVRAAASALGVEAS